MAIVTLGGDTIYNSASATTGVYHRFTPGNFSPNDILVEPDIGVGLFVKCGNLQPAQHTLDVAYIVSGEGFETLRNNIMNIMINRTPRTLSVPEINTTNQSYNKCVIESISPWTKTITFNPAVGFEIGKERWLAKTTITFKQYY
jgi:hypothetical protein